MRSQRWGWVKAGPITPLTRQVSPLVLSLNSWPALLLPMRVVSNKNPPLKNEKYFVSCHAEPRYGEACRLTNFMQLSRCAEP